MAMKTRVKVSILSCLAILYFARCASRAVAPDAAVGGNDARLEVQGGDSASLSPPAPAPESVEEPLQYDVVVVGGGVAGLTSSIYLTEAGKKVLLLDRGPSIDGLQSWSEGQNHISYKRARSEGPDSSFEVVEILKHIGVSSGKEPQIPAESYFWEGGLYVDMWNPATLNRLPPGFSVFERELRAAVAGRKVPSPPFENFGRAGGSMELDGISALTWIMSMAKDNVPMDDVAGFADLYCRAAFGASAAGTSAMAFAVAIDGDREGGAFRDQVPGQAIARMAKTLEDRAPVFRGRPSSPVTSIRSRPEGVEVFYNRDGKSFRVRARYVVFAQELMNAPALIEGFARLEIDAVDEIKQIQYTNVLEHVVRTQGPPYRGAVRTWVQSNGEDPVVFSIGAGARTPVKNEAETEGTFVVPQSLAARGGSDIAETKAQAGRIAERLVELIKKLPRLSADQEIGVRNVTTIRWPLALHTPAPGFFGRIEIMRKPFERVFFASNNLGMPSFEEALFRGHCAAVNVLMRFNRSYKPEKWSRCPIEPGETR